MKVKLVALALALALAPLPALAQYVPTYDRYWGGTVIPQLKSYRDFQDYGSHGYYGGYGQSTAGRIIELGFDRLGEQIMWERRYDRMERTDRRQPVSIESPSEGPGIPASSGYPTRHQATMEVESGKMRFVQNATQRTPLKLYDERTGELIAELDPNGIVTNVPGSPDTVIAWGKFWCNGAFNTLPAKWKQTFRGWQLIAPEGAKE